MTRFAAKRTTFKFNPVFATLARLTEHQRLGSGIRAAYASGERD
jgi:hypothetical protein